MAYSIGKHQAVSIFEAKFDMDAILNLKMSEWMNQDLTLVELHLHSCSS